MLCDLDFVRHDDDFIDEGLNAPFGARCFVTRREACNAGLESGLNAPFGARCFVTGQVCAWAEDVLPRLNAPFGARCFVTGIDTYHLTRGGIVLMHLLALDAL